MSVFDDIASAKVFDQGGNYFVPARFKVKVERAVIEPYAKAPRQKIAKVEFRVMEFEARERTAPSRYKVGDRVSLIVNLSKEMGPTNIKAFITAAGEQLLWSKGATHAKVREFLNDCAQSEENPDNFKKHSEDMFGPESVIKDLVIEVVGFNKPKADGTDFTRLKWLVDRPEDFNPKG